MFYVLIFRLYILPLIVSGRFSIDHLNRFYLNS
jgi:hypothetical protein